MLAKVLKYSKELDKSIEQIAKRQFCRWCLVGGADPSNVPGQMSFPPLAPTSPHHTFLGGIPVNLLVEVSLSLEPKRAARAHHPLPQPFADEAVNAFSTTIGGSAHEPGGGDPAEELWDLLLHGVGS